MRTGVILPTFRDTPDEAFDVAARAVRSGIDGVFCYDHIWPLGQPDRPALAPFPLLGALATRLGPRHTGGSSRGGGQGGPFLGTLVARIGLVPDDVLAAQFAALRALAPGRVIAGLGTGDHLSREENLSYGISFPPASARRAAVVDLGRTLVRGGVTVWIAGGATARVRESLDAGAALNLWDAEPAVVADRASGAQAPEVTWAGPPPDPSTTVHQRVAALHRAGATWVVFAWPVDLDELADAARVLRVRGSGGPGTGP